MGTRGSAKRGATRTRRGSTRAATGESGQTSGRSYKVGPPRGTRNSTSTRRGKKIASPEVSSDEEQEDQSDQEENQSDQEENQDELELDAVASDVEVSGDEKESDEEEKTDSDVVEEATRPSKRSRKREETPDSDGSVITGSPKKKFAGSSRGIASPSTPIQKGAIEGKNNPFLEKTPTTSAIAKLKELAVSSKERSGKEKAKSRIELEHCEVTTPQAPKDDILLESYRNIPKLRAPLSAVNQVLTIQVTDYMRGSKFDLNFAKHLVDLISQHTHGFWIMNPSRADPSWYQKHQFRGSYGECLCDTGDGPSRVACVMFGMAQECNLNSPIPMSTRNQDMEHKSLTLIPFQHEFERNVAFTEMVFGKAAKLPEFQGVISFATIPAKVKKRSFSENIKTSYGYSPSRPRTSNAIPTRSHSPEIDDDKDPFIDGVLYPILKTRAALWTSDVVSKYDAREYFEEGAESIFSFEHAGVLCPRYSEDFNDGDLVAVIYTVTASDHNSGSDRRSYFNYNILSAFLLHKAVAY